MIKEAASINARVKTVLAKYADGVSQEDIDSGKAEPLEVIVREEDIKLTPSQAKELQAMHSEQEE